MGNRGILHGPGRELVCGTWRHKNWVACSLEYKGWHREVMTPHTYTELFFLDEAVSLAAGHRPCAFCRRDDYNRFAAAWELAFGSRQRAHEMDAQLHRGRVPLIRGDRPEVNVRDLPDGAFFEAGDAAWLVWHGRAHRWSHAGYEGSRELNRFTNSKLITAPTIVDVLRNGYQLTVKPMV